MVHLEYNDQNRLLCQRFKGCLSQGICVPGYTLKVFCKSKRRVGVDEVDPVLHAHTESGELAPVEPPYDGSTTEGIGELLCQCVEQILIDLLRQIRDIDLNPCLLGQRQRTSPCACQTPACVARLLWRIPSRAAVVSSWMLCFPLVSWPYALSTIEKHTCDSRGIVTHLLHRL